MKTRLLIIALIGFLSLISFIPHNAYACSCDSYPDYIRTMMESNTAFQGSVTKIIQIEPFHEEVYFDITFPQKGISQTGEYMIEQNRGSSCAVNYNIGETYQVFTYNDGITGTTGMCSTKQITGFSEYSHEDENGQIQHYREDYNILTQYNLGTIILPISIAIIIPSFVIWRKRK